MYSNFKYLATTTTRSQFVLVTYIVFLTKLQKDKPSKKDLPSWKTISQVFEASDIYMFIADIQS